MHFMEHACSLPHSQVPATCPHPEPELLRSSGEITSSEEAAGFCSDVYCFGYFL
jgi:hypothetical protein